MYLGQELAAWDAESGRPLWRSRRQRIEPYKLVVSDGRVFLYVRPGKPAVDYAACLDLKSGKQVWKTENPMPEDKTPYVFFNDLHHALATKEVYLINHGRQSQAFAAADGRLLWERARNRPGDRPDSILQQPLVLGTNIITRGGAALDLLTNKPVPLGLNFNYGGCGPFTGTTCGLFVGQMGSIYDSCAEDRYPGGRLGQRPLCAGRIRQQWAVDQAALHVHGLPGVGRFLRRPFDAQAGCPPAPAPGAGRCEPGVTTAAAGSGDWPTYRSTAARSGSCAAVVPDHAVIRWTCTPSRADSREGSSDGSEQEPAKPDINVTPPVAVGERIWFGTAEGAVVCLDRKTGAEAWRYWTTGRIVSSPTWWRGRLYVGSCDGWVYCLDAATGELAWRYRLAPEDRRVMLWGYLSSAWPVMANVLVAGRRGLCRRGIRECSGRFGAVPRWTPAAARSAGKSGSMPVPPMPARLPPPADSSPGTRDGCGGTAVNGAWRWSTLPPATSGLPSTWIGPTCADCVIVLYGAWEGVKRGQEIGILPGGWVAYGGRQFNLPLSWLEQPRATCCFLRADPDGPPQDPKGLPKLAVLNLSKAHNCGDLPVWDSSEVLLTGRPPAWQTAPLGPRLCCGFAETLAADAAAHPFDTSKKDRGFSTVPVRQTDIEPPAGRSRLVLPDEWVKKYGNRFLSPILASNAVVFASGSGPRGVWNVLAVNRSDQKFLWDVQLPAMPVLGAMSLTRAGDVLVPLVDGRMVCIGDRREAIPRPAVRCVCNAARRDRPILRDRRRLGGATVQSRVRAPQTDWHNGRRAGRTAQQPT